MDDQIRKSPSCESGEIFEDSMECGTVLICGGTNWLELGKEGVQGVPLDLDSRDLTIPHVLGSLADVKATGIYTSHSGCHVIVLDVYGACHLFGRNTSSCLGLSSNASPVISHHKPRRLLPVELGASEGVKFIHAACGQDYSVLVGDDGNVWTAGLNSNGQCGHALSSEVDTFRMVRGPWSQAELREKVVQAAAGLSFTLLLTEGGRVYGFGSGEHGQLGNGRTGTPTIQSKNSVYVTEAEFGQLKGRRIIQVACGQQHAVALEANGVVHAWGNNEQGQLGVGNDSDCLLPIRVPQYAGDHWQPAARGKFIAAGPMSTMVLNWQGLFQVAGKFNSSGTGSPAPSFATFWSIPTMQGRELLLAAAGGATHFVTAKLDYGVMTIAWGENALNYELGLGEGRPTSTAEAVEVETLKGVDVIGLAAGQNTTLFLARPTEALAHLPRFLEMSKLSDVGSKMDQNGSALPQVRHRPDFIYPFALPKLVEGVPVLSNESSLPPTQATEQTPAAVISTFDAAHIPSIQTPGNAQDHLVIDEHGSISGHRARSKSPVPLPPVSDLPNTTPPLASTPEPDWQEIQANTGHDRLLRHQDHQKKALSAIKLKKAPPPAVTVTEPSTLTEWYHYSIARMQNGLPVLSKLSAPKPRVHEARYLDRMENLPRVTERVSTVTESSARRARVHSIGMLLNGPEGSGSTQGPSSATLSVTRAPTNTWTSEDHSRATWQPQWVGSEPAPLPAPAAETVVNDRSAMPTYSRKSTDTLGPSRLKKKLRYADPVDSLSIQEGTGFYQEIAYGRRDIAADNREEWEAHPTLYNILPIPPQRKTRVYPNAVWTIDSLSSGRSGKHYQNASTKKLRCTLPPPFSEPPIWFNSLHNLIDASSFLAQPRYGVQIGDVNYGGLSAVSILLEGDGGPESSWDRDTICIVFRRSVNTVTKKKPQSVPATPTSSPEVHRIPTRSDKEVPNENAVDPSGLGQLTIVGAEDDPSRQMIEAILPEEVMEHIPEADAAALLNTWYSGHALSILVKNDLTILPFRLAQKYKYALVGAFKISKVFVAKTRGMNNITYKMVLTWDYNKNMCNPWWLPSNAPSEANTLIARPIRAAYRFLDPAVGVAERKPTHQVRMEVILFAKTICQSCGKANARQSTEQTWRCESCGEVMLTFHPASHWQLPHTIFYLPYSSISFSDILLGDILVKHGFDRRGTLVAHILTTRTLPVDIEALQALQEKPVDPDQALEILVSQPLVMHREPKRSGVEMNEDDIGEDEDLLTPWYVFRTTEVMAEGDPSEVPDTTRVLDDLRRLLKSAAHYDSASRDHAEFNDLVTVASSEGRDYTFTIETGQVVACMALRAPVIFRVHRCETHEENDADLGPSTSKGKGPEVSKGKGKADSKAGKDKTKSTLYIKRKAFGYALKKNISTPKPSMKKSKHKLGESEKNAEGGNDEDNGEEDEIVLSHGERLVLRATEHVEITIRWLACGFVCIASCS